MAIDYIGEATGHTNMLDIPFKLLDCKKKKKMDIVFVLCAILLKKAENIVRIHTFYIMK